LTLTTSIFSNPFLPPANETVEKLVFDVGFLAPSEQSARR
jgi:hypothetical protein